MDPNEVYEVIPKDVFFIVAGDFQIGELVNLRKIGKLAKVDFSKGAGTGKDAAIIDFTPDNEFSLPIFKVTDRDGDLLDEALGDT